ncbi:MAG: sulfatase [Porphyromonadaceae bacterium]|nr:sulfatase [Porphyromonadaceae bacterium]
MINPNLSKIILFPALASSMINLTTHHAAAQTSEAARQVKQEKMNVLLIMVDDMKPNLGCYGDRNAVSPNIDALAARGTVFRKNYCQVAVSGPTRVSLLTGLRPDNNQVWTMPRPMREIYPDIISMPQYFRSLGYQTAGMGKIFDYRNVDAGNDTLSWSIPFLSEWAYYNKNTERPNGGYMSPETKMRQIKARQEAEALGLKDRPYRQYVNSQASPSTECADVPDDAYMDGALAKLASVTIGKLAVETKQGQPFFLAVGFRKPHLPFVAPKKYWDLYDREKMPLAEFTEKPKNAPNVAFSTYLEILDYSDIPPLYTFSDFNKNSGNIYIDKQKELIHGYYACISYTDALIGEVINALKKNNIDKNTIIILVGDHGWHLGDHGLWAKNTNFEQATRSLMIISDPRIKSSVTDNVTEFIDIFPTLCSMAGLPMAPHIDGVDLTELMKEPSKEVKEVAVSQFSREHEVMGYSLRDTRYRYTVWFSKNYRTTLPYDENLVVGRELYDYYADPLETVNQVDNKKYAEIRKQMHEKLLRHIDEENNLANYHNTKRKIRRIL